MILEAELISTVELFCSSLLRTIQSDYFYSILSTQLKEVKWMNRQIVFWSAPVFILSGTIIHARWALNPDLVAILIIAD